LDGRGGREGFGEADHAHIIGVLFQVATVGAALKARETLRLAPDPSARVTALQRLRTGVPLQLLPDSIIITTGH